MRSWTLQPEARRGGGFLGWGGVVAWFMRAALVGLLVCAARRQMPENGGGSRIARNAIGGTRVFSRKGSHEGG